MTALTAAAARFGPRRKPILKILVNHNDNDITVSRIARVVYAETLAHSLPEVEALCMMIKNTGRELADIAVDADVFESLNRTSVRHRHLLVPWVDPGFQMCLRVVRRMIAELLDDDIYGATRFHRSDAMPKWAESIGSVAEAGELSFYPTPKEKS